MTEAKEKSWIKISLGLTILLVGFAFLSAEMWQSIILRQTESLLWFWTHIGIALLTMMIGGYIAAPAFTERIADAISEHLTPLLDRLPGGRRKTDPPTTPPAN